MPTPLPTPEVPDVTATLNAYRAGIQDRTAREQRENTLEAGGLAAAGNYKGARSALYRGGQFDEARQMSGEMRAIQNQLKSLDDAKLAKLAQGQEALGRLASEIKTPEHLEQAKTLLRSRGLNVDSVTFEQIPMLRQQALTVAQQIELEAQARRAGLDREKFDYERGQDAAKATLERDKLGYQREQDAAKMGLERDKVNILRDKIGAAKAKADAPKPPTEGQANSRYFLGMLEEAETNIGQILGAAGETPLNNMQQGIYNNMPTWASSPALNKQQKQYLQAAQQFVRAKLRKESGATIAPEEFKGEFETFFPQPGDDIRTRRQKAAARRKVLDGFRIMGNAVSDAAPAGNNLQDLSDEDLLNQLSK